MPASERDRAMETYGFAEERPGAPAPRQTIVIERPAKRSLLGRLVRLVVFVVVMLAVVSLFVSRESGMLPSKLGERYVAGEITPSPSAKIAIVEVEGPIMGEAVDHVIKQLHQARDDETVKAVVLRVDSPGGTVSGSDRIWREVEILKA